MVREPAVPLWWHCPRRFHRSLERHARKKKPTRARSASNGAGEEFFGLWERRTLHIGGRMGKFSRRPGCHRDDAPYYARVMPAECEVAPREPLEVLQARIYERPIIWRIAKSAILPVWALRCLVRFVVV